MSGSTSVVVVSLGGEVRSLGYISALLFDAKQGRHRTLISPAYLLLLGSTTFFLVKPFRLPTSRLFNPLLTSFRIGRLFPWQSVLRNAGSPKSCPPQASEHLQGVLTRPPLSLLLFLCRGLCLALLGCTLSRYRRSECDRNIVAPQGLRCLQSAF